MKKVPIWVTYPVIVIGAILSYQTAKTLMIMQEPLVVIVRSSVTLNFLLFLFLWGVASDRATRGMPRKKGWLLWGIGFAAILLVWRFIGGHGTLLG